MTQSLISAIHKKNFEGYFKSNAYLKQLKTTDKKHLKIDVKASHCAPVLQKLLTGEGLDVSELGVMQSHITQLIVEQIEKEHKYFEQLTHRIDKSGKGYATVAPGTVIHSAVNLGSHPYMLHFDFVAAEENVKFAYLSQKKFLEALEEINNAVIDQIGDYVLQ